MTESRQPADERQNQIEYFLECLPWNVFTAEVQRAKEAQEGRMSDQGSDRWREQAERIAVENCERCISGFREICGHCMEQRDAILALCAEVEADQEALTAEAELMKSDLYAIGKALDISAKPYSGHEAVQRDFLPRIAALTAEREHFRVELAAALGHYHALLERFQAAEAERERLREVCHESNAVCACGCPTSEHESYGEEGESCGVEGHSCIRTSQAVALMLERLRRELEEARALVAAVRQVDAAVRRTADHAEWLEPLGRMMTLLEALSASPDSPK